MNEIYMVIRLQTFQQRMRAADEIQPVPAHLRQAQFRWRRHSSNVATHPAEALGHFVLQATRRHQLHTDANAQERLADLGFMQNRLLQSRHRPQPAGAIGERALARQHNPVSRRHRGRIGGDGDVRRQPQAGSRQLKRPCRRGQVAAAVIDHDDFHTGNPSISPGRAVRMRPKARSSELAATTSVSA